jgi:hypothetical protein
VNSLDYGTDQIVEHTEAQIGNTLRQNIRVPASIHIEEATPSTSTTSLITKGMVSTVKPNVKPKQQQQDLSLAWLDTFSMNLVQVLKSDDKTSKEESDRWCKDRMKKWCKASKAKRHESSGFLLDQVASFRTKQCKYWDQFEKFEAQLQTASVSQANTIKQRLEAENQSLGFFQRQIRLLEG